MFENVLVGVDGRLGGRDAIALGARLLAPGGKLTLAHVYAGPLRPVEAMEPGASDDQRREGEELLQRERSEAGIDAELVTIQARSPGRGLHERAEQLGADLLVLGTCRRGVIGRTLLGNDTAAALNGAPCAVAVAPGGYAADGRPFATIGVGYDGSPESTAALEVAKELAEPTHARVRALQLISYPAYVFTGIVPPVGEGITEMVEVADKQMKELPGVEGRADYGLPGQDLAAFSKEVDLLVVGSRGYGPARRLIVGSTAGYLQGHSSCPLVILPRGVQPPGAEGAAAPAAQEAS